MRKIIHFLLGIWHWAWGHLFLVLLFDRNIATARYFTNKYHGIGAEGWKWINAAAYAKIFKDKNWTSSYPIGPHCQVIVPENIRFNIDDLNIFQTRGCYFQAIGQITIGKGTWIAANVGIITANHDFYDLSHHSAPKPVCIGDNCWIGMNSMILPGVQLGDRTIVGAGSIVTKSFPEGNCVIAGNPAKLIKQLENE